MFSYFEWLEILALITINSGSLFLIIILSANSLHDKLYRWLIVMTLSITGWVNFSYLAFFVENPVYAISFYRLNDIFVALFLVSSYKFYVEEFLEIRYSFIKYIHLFINLTFIFLALFTSATIEGVIREEWGNEAVSGIVFDLFILYSFLFTCTLIVLFLYKYFKYTEDKRVKVKYFLIGTTLFALFNIIFNVLSPLFFTTGKFQHFGDYSAVFLLGFTAYAILRYQFLNVKIALTALLIGVLGMLVVIDMFALSRTLLEQGVKFVILIFFAIISVFLVRSVLNEIRQKEQLAKINKALDESRQRYIDLASEQKDIIDVMGHEIRTPLTAIVQEIKIHKKYTLPVEKELLEEAKGLPQLSKVVPYLIETVKTVDRASTHAVALVSDMLETARLDKNRFELNYETFDLVNVVRSNVELMRKSVDVEDESVKYNIEFVEPEFQEFNIEADKTRIGQAVYAILNNAIKYRDPAKDNVTVKVIISKTDKEAMINVADNGIGIDKEDIAKLGKKFMRLNPKTNGNLKRPGGTGLGLFVVKGIMEHHKGEMIVESQGIGHGSTFVLRFPVKASV